MSKVQTDKLINTGAVMSIEGADTAGCTKAISIYDDFNNPKESGSISFPAICQTQNSGIVLFVGRVYNKSWLDVQIFSSIPLANLKQTTANQQIGLSSQGPSRERNFYWNGTGITIGGGSSVGIVKIIYLY